MLEVGLGGRLDATNVVSPIAAAITSIDFDHQAQLGDSLESIAAEKAGIIKPGIPVVCGPAAARGRSRHGRDAAVHAAHGSFAALDRRSARVPSRRRPRPSSAFVRHRIKSREIELALSRSASDRQCRRRHVPAGRAQAAVSRFRGRRDRRWALTHRSWPARLERRTWQGADVCWTRRTTRPAHARWRPTSVKLLGWNPQECDARLRRDEGQGRRAASWRRSFRCSTRVVCTTAASPRALSGVGAGGGWPERCLRAGRASRRSRIRQRRYVRPACRAARVVVAGSIFLVGPLRGILR